MREPIDIIRCGREVYEPREQRALGRSCLRSSPRPWSGGIRYFVLCAGDDGRGGRVTRGGSQPDDVRERVADRLEVRIDCGRSRAARRAREFAAQRGTHEVAHRLGGELGLGEEIAKLCQRSLPNERSFRMRLPRTRVLREAYLGRHVAAWNHACLEERAARLVGVGDRTFRALGGRDDDHAAFACLAESGH